MIRAPGLSRDHRAFSAFYGAFAVLLAATLVFGAMAARGPGDEASDRAREDRLAHAFLDALLLSTSVRSNSTVGAALSVLCPAAPCAEGTDPDAFLASLGSLAQSLARPMGCEFLLVLTAPPSAEVRIGGLEPAPGLPMSRADAYNLDAQALVILTLFLECA